MRTRTRMIDLIKDNFSVNLVFFLIKKSLFKEYGIKTLMFKLHFKCERQHMSYHYNFQEEFNFFRNIMYYWILVSHLYLRLSHSFSSPFLYCNLYLQIIIYCKYWIILQVFVNSNILRHAFKWVINFSNQKSAQLIDNIEFLFILISCIAFKLSLNETNYFKSFVTTIIWIKRRLNKNLFNLFKILKIPLKESFNTSCDS
jgi:hypothetical protein